MKKSLSREELETAGYFSYEGDNRIMIKPVGDYEKRYIEQGEGRFSYDGIYHVPSKEVRVSIK